MGILTIDDRDPLLSYSPSSAWSPGGVSNEYNSTTTYAASTGSTIKLTFTGTNVGVFGTLNPNSVDGPPSSSYSIDNGTPTVFNGVQSSAPLYRQRFFASGPLSPSTHTLLITLLSKNSTYFLDYILVTLPDPGATSISSSSSTSFSSSSTSSSSSSSSRSPSLRPTTTSSSTSPSSHGSQTSTDLPVGASSASHAGTIVGGVLGGIALILLALIAILYILKRRREKEMEQDFDPGTQSLWTRYTPSNAQLTPFITSRYQRIDDGQFGMLDNPRMTPQPLVDPFQSTSESYRGVGLNHVPPNPSSSSLPHSKSAFRKHGASPSQHSLVSQIPPTDTSSSHHHPAPAASSSRNATTSAQARSNYTDANSLPPPPRYDY